MKKNILVVATLFSMLLILLSACNKDNQEAVPDEEIYASQELAVIQSFVEDTEDEVEYQLESAGLDLEFRNGECPEVTSTEEIGTYPNTITIDFGEECEGPNGRIRSGMVVIDISAPLDEEGATRTVTFVEFFIEGAQITGGKVFTNEGLNDNGKPCITRSVDVTVAFPDGTSATWKANHKVCKIGGLDTDTKMDDIFAIAGFSAGKNRNGGTYSAEIVEPLIKDRNCRYLVAGVKQVTINGTTRSLDYGNGFCDRFAKLTLANGQEVTILLKAWWK